MLLLITAGSDRYQHQATEKYGPVYRHSGWRIKLLKSDLTY
jgi:hypothetical protein